MAPVLMLGSTARLPAAADGRPFTMQSASRGYRLFCKYSNTKCASPDELNSICNRPLRANPQVAPLSSDMILDGQTRHFSRSLRSQVGEEPKTLQSAFIAAQDPDGHRGAQSTRCKALGQQFETSSAMPIRKNNRRPVENVWHDRLRELPCSIERGRWLPPPGGGD
jgi:hypothetical protein